MVNVIARPATVIAALPATGQGGVQAQSGAAAKLANLASEAGFTPLEFLDAALSGCLVLSLRIAARQRGWLDRLKTVQVAVTHEKAHDLPSRVAAFDCVFEIDGDFSAAEREQLIAAAHEICTVGNSLAHGAIIRDAAPGAAVA